jgi:hypothetical protein
VKPEHVAGLEAALDAGGGTHTLQDVADKVEAGEAQLWEEENAVVVTELVTTPQMKVLHFWLGAGELEDVVALQERLIEWGKSVGCQRAALSGRKGWEKVLAGSGWSPELVLMGRDISDGIGQRK